MTASETAKQAGIKSLKVMPKHDKPLGHDFETWRDTEINKHLKQLHDRGQSTATVKAYLEDHYSKKLYDHHVAQIARVKTGQSPVNIKRKEPEKLVHRKKKLVIVSNNLTKQDKESTITSQSKPAGTDEGKAVKDFKEMYGGSQ